ncbi:HEAT repeat domain-containing protein [Phytomonospora endophytica]|uniref:HEAT repeat domain-containing protein n=1 Tax=Phytomonospora endophytica TaxID=714109 RepID=A0A841FM48_9ACTN|nr:HEAT repeat domain-containing protein [Phytomonospora endophytica]MBB6038391.1 hypothetical protein [Phytomonospora endophytica]
MTAGPASRRLVLKTHTGVIELQRSAEELGFDSLGMLDRDPVRRTYTELAWEARDGVTVHYVEDEFADERFVVARGGTSDAREDVLDRFAEVVDVWSLDDLMYEVSAARYASGRARAVMRLGVGSPLTAVDSVVVRITHAATDPDPRVRKAAVWAMAYADWPEYGDALVYAAADHDLGIARAATTVLDRLGEAA